MNKIFFSFFLAFILFLTTTMANAFYDPSVGRFITEDTYLGEPGTPPSLNHYLYAYSNPTVFIDLEGYASVSTMIDRAAEGCGGVGCYGWAFLKTVYSASTLGFASVHDPQRDAYDAGKISGAKYTVKGIGGGGALVAANVMTGRMAGAAMAGKSLLAQTVIGASTGAGMGAFNDAAAQASNIDTGAQQSYNYQQTGVSALIGGGLGGAAPASGVLIQEISEGLSQSRIGSFLTREPRSGVGISNILKNETGSVGPDIGDVIARNKLRGGAASEVASSNIQVAEAGPGAALKTSSGWPETGGSGPVSGTIGITDQTSVGALRNYTPKGGGVEFVYDPVTNTFVTGRPSRGLFQGSPHEQLAKSIGANERPVVGGTFQRGAKGEIITTENSGHYGPNWTGPIRQQFQNWLNGRTGMPVYHQPWSK